MSADLLSRFRSTLDVRIICCVCQYPSQYPTWNIRYCIFRPLVLGQCARSFNVREVATSKSDCCSTDHWNIQILNRALLQILYKDSRSSRRTDDAKDASCFFSWRQSKSIFILLNFPSFMRTAYEHVLKTDEMFQTSASEEEDSCDTWLTFCLSHSSNITCSLSLCFGRRKHFMFVRT